jgi:hypothetical protein
MAEKDKGTFLLVRRLCIRGCNPWQRIIYA